MSGKRALVFILPGLGDAIVSEPIINGLMAEHWTIDALTMLDAVAVFAEQLNIFDHVVNVPLLTNQLGSIRGVLQLWSKNYDVVVLPFPATRWQYALLGRIVARNILVMHDYGGMSSIIARTGRSTLQILRGGHRIAENGRLASAMGLPKYDEFLPLIPTQWTAKEQQDVIAIHTGTMQYKGNESRRWPFENFISLMRAQIKKGRRLRVFAGPFESEDVAAIRNAIDSPHLEIVQSSLPIAAASLANCRLFIGNDSGMAHVAAALGVQTLTLFGMTNPVRATPLGLSRALRPSACPPCHDEGSKAFECCLGIDYRCSKVDLSVEYVISAVDDAIENGVDRFVPQITGDARLYGKAIS